MQKTAQGESGIQNVAATGLGGAAVSDCRRRIQKPGSQEEPSALGFLASESIADIFPCILQNETHVCHCMASSTQRLGVRSRSRNDKPEEVHCFYHRMAWRLFQLSH